MDKTLSVGIAFRGCRDSVPHCRDGIPRHRDSVPPLPSKSAPIQVMGDANRPLPSFYLFLPANIPKTLWIICRVRRGAPLRGSPTFGGSPSPTMTSRLCVLDHRDGTLRAQVHEPRRGKPLASPMHRLRLRLAGGKGAARSRRS